MVNFRLIPIVDVVIIFWGTLRGIVIPPPLFHLLCVAIQIANSENEVR